MKRAWIAAVAALATASAAVLWWVTTGNEPRKALPDIELRRLEGGSDRLSEWRGKTVILNVWATWCPPCRVEMQALEKLSFDLDQGRYAVIGVSVDDNPVLVREFLRENVISFAKHIDPKRELTRGILDVHSLPQTLIIDGDGRLRQRVVGARDWHEGMLPSVGVE